MSHDLNVNLTPPAFPAVNDFFRSGPGATTLPDGSNDLIEDIRRDGNVGLRVDPISTLDVLGSYGVAITTSSAASLVLLATDSTVVLTLAGLQNIVLPSATTVLRRIITLSNPTAIAKITSAYLNLTGTSTTTIPANSTITLQSDGANWRLLDGNSLPITANDFWRSGVGGTTQPDGLSDVTENIRRNGNVGVNTDPVSFLDVNGSYGVGITSDNSANVTVTLFNSTVILPLVGVQTVGLQRLHLRAVDLVLVQVLISIRPVSAHNQE
jgi:hypothetical protein